MVNYDTKEVSFERLCKISMAIHKAETEFKANYRSVIQTNNEEDFKFAKAFIESLKKDKNIKTEVEKIGKASTPEAMHEDWHKLKGSEPKCNFPEMSFEDLLKSLN